MLNSNNIVDMIILLVKADFMTWGITRYDNMHKDKCVNLTRRFKNIKRAST